MTIRPVTLHDADDICEIYNHYVRSSVATFEEAPVAAGEMRQRIADITAALPWLVAERQGTLHGYAYAAPWKSRSAYRHTVESTIYLRPALARRGIGQALYGALIADLRRRGCHCVLGGISLPNTASIALHEKLGFVKVGHMPEVGRKLDRWVDVGYWALVLG